ncbi:hypothetical protein AGMMS49959_03950 [Planctomycetales bacterium]|nr:hypothetical protein AGMMS49959_03950 [Planctomycetales bacterium]
MAKSASPAASYADHRRAVKDAAEKLPPLVVLTGAETYLADAALTLLRARFREKFPALTETVFYGDGKGTQSQTLSAVNAELSGGNLFGGEKLVIFRRAQSELFPVKISDAADRALREFAAYWQAPADGVFGVVEVEKINAARSVGKGLANAVVIPCPQLANPSRDLDDWTRQTAQAQGKTLSRDAVELLCRCHGGDLRALADEIEKCALYLGDEAAEITAETAAKFLPDGQDFNRFGLTNALERRNRAEALRYARLLTDGARDEKGKWKGGADAANATLAMVASRFEQLARARLGDGGDVAARLKLSPWLADKIAEAARNFLPAQIVAALEIIAAEIHATHATGADAEFSLDKVVAAICKTELRVES